VASTQHFARVLGQQCPIAEVRQRVVVGLARQSLIQVDRFERKRDLRARANCRLWPPPWSATNGGAPGGRARRRAARWHGRIADGQADAKEQRGGHDGPEEPKVGTAMPAPVARTSNRPHMRHGIGVSSATSSSANVAAVHVSAARKTPQRTRPRRSRGGRQNEDTAQLSTRDDEANSDCPPNACLRHCYGSLPHVRKSDAELFHRSTSGVQASQNGCLTIHSCDW
jgi:hypothetical protein